MYIVYNHLLICGHIQALIGMQCIVLKDVYFTRAMNVLHIAFSALTLFVGRHNEVLAWLSVWSEVQMICVWSSWCHCHPVASCLIKVQIGVTVLVPAYLG